MSAGMDVLCWLKHQRSGRVLISSREPTTHQTSKTSLRGQPQRGHEIKLYDEKKTKN